MRDLGDDLNRLEVPEHRSGFWSELDEQMAGVRRSAPRTATLRGRRWMAVAAAAVTVAAFAILPGLLTGGEEVGGDGVGDTSTTTAPAESTTTAEATTTTFVDTGPTQAGSPPWGATKLTRDQVPAVFVDVWTAAENQTWCSALAPNSPTPPAEPRRAIFSGGWAVAFDRAEGPGRNADGSICADCGRSAYGIAGVGLAADRDLLLGRPEVREYSDGSLVAIYPEGFDESSAFLLADIVLPDQGCLYQAWSSLGRDHLEGFLAQLRRVDGLEAAALVPRTAADTVREERGTPPWAASRISAEDVLAVAFERSLDTNPVPVMAFTDLGPGLERAQLRPAALGNWGVAWDNPDGPGHDGLNYPCADCGRGVIGIGAFGPYDPEGPGDWADPALMEITWEDGSLAVITWRIGDLRLPADQVVFPDPATGELVPDGVQATLYIPNGGTYQLWSHLGLDHLLLLLENLRFAER